MPNTPLNKKVELNFVDAYQRGHMREALEGVTNLRQIQTIIESSGIIPNTDAGAEFRNKALATLMMVSMGSELNPSSVSTKLVKQVKLIMSPDQGKPSGCIKYYAVLFGCLMDLFIRAFNIRWPNHPLPWHNAKGYQVHKTVVVGMQPVGVYWPLVPGRGEQVAGKDPVLFYADSRGFGLKMYQHGGGRPIKFLDGDYPLWIPEKTTCAVKPVLPGENILALLNQRLKTA